MIVFVCPVMIELSVVVVVLYVHPACEERASSDCSLTSLLLSANTQVGYHSTPARSHMFLFLSQSINLICANASYPNASFCALQWLHRVVPYMIAHFSVRHCASATLAGLLVPLLHHTTTRALMAISKKGVILCMISR